MNRISLVRSADDKKEFWAIQVDGKPLREYFTGYGGVHPSQIPSVSWSTADESVNRRIIDEFLFRASGELQSNRTPVLVCEECGDVACGAFAVRITRTGSVVRWSDWAWENGDGRPRPVDDWATIPPPFEFLWKDYEEAFSNALPRV
jgi:hypothetical protein